MQRLNQRLAHDPGRGHGAIDAVASHHVDDSADTAAFLAQHNPIGVLKLDFGGSIGAITQLVLYPLDRQIVALTIRPPPRHKETGNAHTVCIGQHQKSIAHRCRTEKLVAGEQIVGTNSGLNAHWHRNSRIGTHVRAALFFCHKHADQRAGLFCHWNITRVINVGQHTRHPLGLDFWGGA